MEIVWSYLAPAPFPAPATPLPAAETTAPAKLPTPDAAALVVRVSQLWFCGAMIVVCMSVCMCVAVETKF